MNYSFICRSFLLRLCAMLVVWSALSLRHATQLGQLWQLVAAGRAALAWQLQLPAAALQLRRQGRLVGGAGAAGASLFAVWLALKPQKGAPKRRA